MSFMSQTLQFEVHLRTIIIKLALELECLWPLLVLIHKEAQFSALMTLSLPSQVCYTKMWEHFGSRGVRFKVSLNVT